MNKICYSSEVYGLAVEDILSLPDAQIVANNIPNDEVIILIGRRKLWFDDVPVVPDTLLKGRDVVMKAQKNGEQYIPVRVAFESRTKSYDLISPIIRSLRYKHILFGSNIYHIRAQEIRAKKIERNFRNSENAYVFSNPKYQMSDDARKNTYAELKKSMQEKGFDDNYPLDIMLCRNMGIKDTLNQGHHRMSVALECGIERVSVVFCAAGQAPKCLHTLFTLIANLNMSIKRLLNRLKS